ncbi:MAG: N-6 DNA methylase [Oscillospiraceae bacterium]|jgi:hypothetical protein|nr:N-6 DNA methylase [Oscillospiraceae bacterium]
MNVNYQKEIIKLIKQAAYSRGEYQVFNDWLEMSAISISNSIDPTHREEREKRYLDIIGSYGKREQETFPQMFAHLVEALQNKVENSGTEDVLGLIFHELELHNKYKGKFFTPQNVSDCMAFMTFDDLQSVIEKNGFISACEPCCGSGVMITSMCKAMQKAELNYCTQLVVTAVDIDIKCVHMTYLQLSLYGVPAVVIHGNSITCEEFSRWYTPVYLLNGWIWREQCRINNKFCVHDEMIKCASEPMYAAFRQVQTLTADIKPTAPAPVNKTVLTLTEPDKTGQLSLFDF